MTYKNVFSQSDSLYQIKTKLDTTKFEMKKSAMGAVLRSAIIPGWGQFYNEAYWKIPVVWGSLAYLGYIVFDNNKLYKHYQDLYQASLLNDEENKTFLRLREFYRDQRDINIVFLGLAYLLNLLDAFVDAHLFDFTVEENRLNNSYNLKLNFRL
jgi:hypothetical protein